MLLLRASALWIVPGVWVCAWGLKPLSPWVRLHPLHGEAGKKACGFSRGLNQHPRPHLNPVWQLLPAKVMTPLHDVSSLAKRGPGVVQGVAPKTEKNKNQGWCLLPRRRAVSQENCRSPRCIWQTELDQQNSGFGLGGQFSSASGKKNNAECGFLVPGV